MADFKFTGLVDEDDLKPTTTTPTTKTTTAESTLTKADETTVAHAVSTATSTPTINAPLSNDSTSPPAPTTTTSSNGAMTATNPFAEVYGAAMDPADADTGAAAFDNRRSIYFRGAAKKRIDYVLAHGVTSDGAGSEGGAGRESDHHDEEEEEHRKRREVFEAELVEAHGLEIEERISLDGDTRYVLIHAPFDVLRFRAEMMRLKMPMRDELFRDADPATLDDFVEHTGDIGMMRLDDGSLDRDHCKQEEERRPGRRGAMKDRLKTVWRGLTRPFRLDPNVVPPPADVYTCRFMRDRQDVFDIRDEDTFFSPAQRSRLVFDILVRAAFDDDDDAGLVGIEPLLSKGTYDAAFPLHDGNPEVPADALHAFGPTDTDVPDRQRLYYSWGRFSQFYKEQPFHLIREYFGEKIAIYFAWLGFYTVTLIPVAFLGIVATLYGFGAVAGDFGTKEICDPTGDGNRTMCPQCRQPFCSYWRLGDSCDYARITSVFDNDFTVFFAFIMSVWTVLFLEFWKRRQAALTFYWDLEDFEDEVSIRPDYEAKCSKKRVNPISGVLEPVFPAWKRIPRYLTGMCVALLAVGCVLIAIVGVIFYRVTMRIVLYRMEADDKGLETVKSHSKIIVSVTAALINLIIIMFLNKVYASLALKITKLETQKTDKDYEDSFTLKMFCFQFVNFYASIFYIAFFKGRFFEFFDNSEDHRSTSPARYDQCDPAGCFIELFIQMFIIMVGKQTFSNVQEFLLPRIMKLYRERMAKKSNEIDAAKDKPEIDLKDLPQWERDFALAEIGDLGLFNEYLEMVIQFGFVSLFVAAFPLAPFFALLNNVIEIRLDANKFTCSLRRQRPMRVKDIGAWFYILNSVAYLAVTINALVIAFTSNFIERSVYKLTSSSDGTLRGFASWTLSAFDVDSFNNETRPDTDFRPLNHTCFYRDFRAGSDRGYERTTDWYEVMLAKVAFVLVFEHVIFLARDVLAWIVPDVPKDVAVSVKKEAYWVRKALYGREMEERKGGKRGKREKGGKEEKKV